MQRHGRKRTRPGRARAGHRPSHHGADELLARRRADAHRALARSHDRLTSLATRSAATTTRCLRRRLQRLGRRDRRAHRCVRLSRVRRQRTRARESARARGGARLDRQAHESARSRRLVVPARRAVHRPAAAARCARRRALRLVPRVHGRLPDASHRRAVRGRRAPLHLVSRRSSCAARFPKHCGRRSATGSSAATTASSFAPGTSLRSRRASATSRSAMGSTARGLVELFAWTESRMARPTEGSRATPRRLRRLAPQRRRRPRQRAADARVVAALEARVDDPSAIVREHVQWALAPPTSGCEPPLGLPTPSRSAPRAHLRIRLGIRLELGRGPQP